MNETTVDQNLSPESGRAIKNGIRAWKNLKRDYTPKYDTTNQYTPSASPNKPTLNRLLSRQKLERLKVLTLTNYLLINSLEPYRISAYLLLCKNITDVTLYLSTSVIYLLCYVLTCKLGKFPFLVLLFVLLYIFNKHVESFRSFVNVSKTISLLSEDYELRKAFLLTCSGRETHRRIYFVNKGEKLKQNSLSSSTDMEIENIDDIDATQRDSFHWINEIVAFFWPYFSHIIHFELNEFFRDEIQSRSFRNSHQSLKKLIDALVKQIDSNILLIEKAQLGQNTPFIKYLNVYEEHSAGNKSLVADINLEYNGDIQLLVIYKYFCCLLSRVGLRDIFFKIDLRIAIGPLLKNSPYCEKLEISLLKLPDFGYKGIAITELAELKAVRGVINKLVKDNILFPKAISINLSDVIETLIASNHPETPQNSRSDLLDLTNDQNESISEKIEDEDNKSQGRACWFKLAAKTILCSLCCTNCLLKLCCCCRKQRERRRTLSDSK